jgi:hypothetical protein
VVINLSAPSCFCLCSFCNCRPLTLKVRWNSFADFCTDQLFPYFYVYSFTGFFLKTGRFHREHLTCLNKTNWPEVSNSWILNDIGRKSLLGNRKKIAKFLMRTFTCRSTFLYDVEPQPAYDFRNSGNSRPLLWNWPCTNLHICKLARK